MEAQKEEQKQDDQNQHDGSYKLEDPAQRVSKTEGFMSLAAAAAAAAADVKLDDMVLLVQ